jgi:radical SAM superfamily enzyme YgiQ (UPF0313 family)
MLELLQKDETLDDMLEANRRLAAAGIPAAYNFLVGLPTESEQDVHRTIDFALRLLRDNPRAQVSGFYIYVPYPGTRLFDKSVQAGFVPPAGLDAWSAFSRQHTDTPWVARRRRFYKTVMYSAKFVDGNRLGDVLSGTCIPGRLPRGLSAFYRKRWEKKWLAYTPDIWLLDLAARALKM